MGNVEYYFIYLGAIYILCLWANNLVIYFSTFSCSPLNEAFPWVVFSKIIFAMFPLLIGGKSTQIVHSYLKWNRPYLTSLHLEISMTSFKWCIEKDDILKSVFLVYFARFTEPRWYAYRNRKAQVVKHFVITLSWMPICRPCGDSDQPRHGGEQEAGQAFPHSVSLGSFQLSLDVFLKNIKVEESS